MATATADNMNHLTVPREIVLRAEDNTPRFTPRELDMIQERFGKSYIAVLEEHGNDMFKMLAWLKLRREGYDVTFDDMYDTLIAMTGEAPDPTNATGFATLPDSAISGE